MRMLRAAVILIAVASGCGANNRPYTFGGNPNNSPESAPVGSATQATLDQVSAAR